VTECLKIRSQVFCQEQGVDPALEWDGLDDECEHYLAVCDGIPVGTARTRIYARGIGKIERVAVIAAMRRAGVGAAIMARAIERLREHGVSQVILNSQTAVAAFYAALGFVAEGPEFEEANIPHVRMALTLTRAQEPAGR